VTREGRIGMRFFVAKGIGYSAGLGSILSGIKLEERCFELDWRCWQRC
jgi:hypothetical protein